jgi:hypothetical protein
VIKIAGKWMFIPLKMVLIGIDPYPIGAWIKRPCKLSGITSWLKPSFENGSLCEGDEITSVTLR